MSFQNLISSCLPFIPFTQCHPDLIKKTSYRDTTAHSHKKAQCVNGENPHKLHLKDRIANLFSRLCRPSESKPSTASTEGKFSSISPAQANPECASSSTDASNVVKSVQATGKTLEKDKVSKIVQKGLDAAVEYCKKRDERYGHVEDNEIFFHAKDILSLNQLAVVIEYYIAHKNEWKVSTEIMQEGWPCSIVGDSEKAYLLFPLIIGKGGTQTQINLGMDLSTGENVVIKQLDSSAQKNFDTISLPGYMQNKLNSLFVDDNKGGLLPLKRTIDFSTNNIIKQFIVQKLCTEGNLLTLLRSGIKLTADEIKTISDDILKAVEVLHHNQILHKDLKPENIFIHNGRAYLGDYDYTSSLRGSFTENADNEKKVNTVGSFPYLPPETVLLQEYGPQSEVYGVGLILYSLFAYHQPRVVQELGEKGPDFNYSTARFNSWNPWRKEEPESKGAELVSKMICTDPNERFTLKNAYAEFLKIPAAELAFTHQETPSKK